MTNRIINLLLAGSCAALAFMLWTPQGLPPATLAAREVQLVDVDAILSKTIPSLELVDVPRSIALKRIMESTDLSFVVRADQVDLSDPVTCSLKNPTIRQALHAIALPYRVDDGVIIIDRYTEPGPSDVVDVRWYVETLRDWYGMRPAEALATSQSTTQNDAELNSSLEQFHHLISHDLNENPGLFDRSHRLGSLLILEGDEWDVHRQKRVLAQIKRTLMGRLAADSPAATAPAIVAESIQPDDFQTECINLRATIDALVDDPRSGTLRRQMETQIDDYIRKRLSATFEVTDENVIHTMAGVLILKLHQKAMMAARSIIPELELIARTKHTLPPATLPGNK